MSHDHLTRRDVLKTGSAAMAITLANMALPEFVFPGQADDEELVPFENVPRSRPNMLDWETLDSWITPQDQVFSVQHYDVPEFDPADFALQITGLVERPKTLTMADLKALPKDDQLMTLECSGNGANPGFIGAVYNSKWTGTRLWPLLESCGIKPGAIEAVFFGVDKKEETLRKGTSRELSIEVPFGRSMAIADAKRIGPLLAYERDGQPLEKRNGAPLRLIVPGWYGIANVKWLTRIDIRNRRYMGRFMGRDYVTVRGERQGDEVVFVESSVTKMNLKSIVARVTRGASSSGLIPVKAYGAVWSDGTEIAKVEVQLDDGTWQTARLDAEPKEKFCWRFFSIDLGKTKSGSHTLVSRAIDTNNRIQPAAEDDEIALKRTYWEANQQWPREIVLES